MRRLIVAVVALAVAGLAGAPATLQAQPAPPNRFYGSLTIDGVAAPIGTNVVAVQAGKECGSRATDTPGQYWVDAASSGQIAGCGTGDPVQFRVGSRFADQTGTWNGGTFTQLNLTVTGSGTATPPPTTGNFSLAKLDMTGSLCIPAQGQTACDATRQKLWNGDKAAWTQQRQSEGKPAPSDDDVFLATYEYRIGANDPAAIRSLAQGLGWPKVYITAVRFKGTGAAEGDEYIEITNVGGASQDMTGWRALAVESNTSFYFTDGSVLDPGATCRFYTGGTRADSCPGTVLNNAAGVWNDNQGSAQLWYDPLQLLADSTRYNAAPGSQPPAPNLQGVSGPVS